MRLVIDLSEMLGVGRMENPEGQGECSHLAYALNITGEPKAFSRAFVQTLGAECKRESSHSIQKSRCRGRKIRPAGLPLSTVTQL